MKFTKQQTYVIVAAYNEQRHIEDVLGRIRKQGYPHVVVVDDGSRDRTEDLARKAGATVVRHILNLGKGAGMKTGADAAVREGAKALIFVDGDGQHKPEELDLFLKAMNEGNEIVFGARREGKHMPVERRLGQWLMRTVIRKVYNYDLHDPLGGYRALTAAAYKRIRWKSRDYFVECEMIARAGKEVLEYDEVTVSTVYHDRHKGMTVFDGAKVMLKLVWWRMTH